MSYIACMSNKSTSKLGASDGSTRHTIPSRQQLYKPPKAMTDIGLIRKHFDRGNMAKFPLTETATLIYRPTTLIIICLFSFLFWNGFSSEKFPVTFRDCLILNCYHLAVLMNDHNSTFCSVHIYTHVGFFIMSSRLTRQC